MAPEPTRKTATGVTKRPRLSQAEATARTSNATAQLLLENVPREVTFAQICDKAGVHPDYVVRFFGSREELLCQAIEAAFIGVFLSTNDGETTRLNLVLEGKSDVQKLAQARTRTIAEVNDMTDQQRQDVLAYLGYMSQTGETVQAALGWDVPTAKPKKRK